MNRKYFDGGIRSEGHTPIYKMHKYFARRPHNVFRTLIEQYSAEGDLIVDCFGGGGVTLVEGLSAKRRVISYDINPMASFIQYAQVLNITTARLNDLSKKVQDGVIKKFHKSYTTSCRKCEEDAHVRWFEHAYKVSCPACNAETFLDVESKKIGENGKRIDGSYTCNSCKSDFRVSNVLRHGSKILNLRYKCDGCGAHETTTPNLDDIEKFEAFIKNEKTIIEKHDLTIPEDSFPSYWDRQREDCLISKGFVKFRDLFTVRNLLISAQYFKELEALRPECTEDEWFFMVFLVSSLLRYTNNMTFSVNGWMDGRPVAWAKHAYWTPNQFIECNPMEYFENRIKAAKTGIKDRSSRYTNAAHSDSEEAVVKRLVAYSVRNSSSSHMNIPDSSVDAVITDPPYGSNVQYGELCHFWLVWLKDKLPFKFNLFDLNEEVVVHRKKGQKGESYSKNFETYRAELTEIYSECFRVLKEGGVMAFTFNNRNPSAWFAVIKAALDAGFMLEEGGITYQEQIEAYRDTAHLRFEGTAQGDFIYSFVKKNKGGELLEQKHSLLEARDLSVKKVLNNFIKRNQPFSESELFIACYKKILGTLCEYIRNGASEEEVLAALNFNKTLDELEERTEFKKTNGLWEVSPAVFV